MRLAWEQRVGPWWRSVQRACARCMRAPRAGQHRCRSRPDAVFPAHAWRVAWNERGAALIVALVLMAVMTLLGTAAVVTGIVDTKIGTNYRLSVQAFYAAEAGLAEARERLRASAGGAGIAVPPANPQWRAYLVSGVAARTAAEQKAAAVGYVPQSHTLYTSLQSELDYTVVVEPTAAAVPSLRLTSYGTMGSATRTLQAVAVPPPTVLPPAALSVAAPTTIQGLQTVIAGTDRCGNNHQPAVHTPLAEIQAGLPTVQALSAPTLLGTSEITYNGATLDIQGLVDALQPYANFAYTVTHAIQTASTRSGPGDGWGRPEEPAVTSDPSTCAVYHVIHYETGGTSLTLHQGVTGCGLLLVEGNLTIQEDFSWHGLILVTGVLTMATSTPHAQRITGAVLAGGTVGTNVLGEHVHLGYCSTAVSLRHLPWRMVDWREMY